MFSQIVLVSSDNGCQHLVVPAPGAPMARKEKANSWYTQHKSAVLIFGLFVFGLVLLTIGVLVEEGDRRSEKFLGKLLIELSIASFVGGIATLFLSLPDVRHQLSSVLATLFSEGKIAGLLSVTARELLNKELVQHRLGAEVARIDPDLFRSLTELTDDGLRCVNLHDYHLVTSFGPHRTNPAAFLHQRAVITFRINICHLLSAAVRVVKFPYKVAYDIDLPFGIEMTDEEFLQEFRLKIGATEFTEAKISRQEHAEVRSVKFEFETEFDLTAETTSVEVTYRAARLKSDNVSIWRARYPTCGFQTSVHYTRDFDYSGKWFTSIGSKSAAGMFASLDNGITATRDDWVLPGEGIAIYWMSKDQGGVAAPPAGNIETKR
jgi:hypothetical protein